MVILRKFKLLLFQVILKIKLFIKIRKNSVNYFLLDVPEYGNLGDQAIFYAEKKFLKEKNITNNLITIKSYYIDNEECYKYIISKISKKDVIFLTGGGSLDNNGYIVVERFVKIINDLKNNKIIIFPQTIMFNSNNVGIELLHKTKNAFEKHNDLHIFVREKNSYNYVVSNYNCNIYLVPDIVLYLTNSIKELKKNNKVLILFRKDKESIMKNDIKNKVIQILKNKINKIEYNDTFIKSFIFKARGKYFINSNRDLIKFWQKCSKSEYIITDRLHGMIFGAITKTKTIAFNNSNGKIGGVYEWLKSSNYVKFVNNLEEFTKSMEELQKIKEIKSIDFTNAYNKIIEVINNE